MPANAGTQKQAYHHYANQQHRRIFSFLFTPFHEDPAISDRTAGGFFAAVNEQRGATPEDTNAYEG